MVHNKVTRGQTLASSSASKLLPLDNKDLLDVSYCELYLSFLHLSNSFLLWVITDSLQQQFLSQYLLCNLRNISSIQDSLRLIIIVQDDAAAVQYLLFPTKRLYSVQSNVAIIIIIANHDEHQAGTANVTSSQPGRISTCCESCWACCC